MDRTAKKQARDDIFNQCKLELLQRATVASTTVTANSANVPQLQPCPPNTTKKRGQTSLVWRHCKKVSHNEKLCFYKMQSLHYAICIYNMNNQHVQPFKARTF